jgi:hypothetical protein
MHSSFLKLSFWCVALTLAGCAVGPNYQRPAVNAPVGFRDASNQVSTNSLERQIALKENEINTLLGRNPSPVPRTSTLLAQELPVERQSELLRGARSPATTVSCGKRSRADCGRTPACSRTTLQSPRRRVVTQGLRVVWSEHTATNQQLINYLVTTQFTVRLRWSAGGSVSGVCSATESTLAKDYHAQIPIRGLPCRQTRSLHCPDSRSRS